MSDSYKYEDNIKELREKTEQEMLQLEFKKRFLGGINQKEVISYVNSIKEQAQRAEETFKERINELSSTREAMRSDQKNIKDQLDAALKQVERYENNIKNLEEDKQIHQRLMDSRLSEILSENERLTSSLNEMKSKLIAVEDSQQRLMDNRLDEVLSENERLTNALNETKSKLIAVEDNHQQIMDNRLGEVLSENERLTSALNEIKNKLKDAEDNQQQIMDNRLGEALNENERLTSALNEMESKLKDAEDKMDEMAANNLKDNNSAEYALKLIESENKIAELTKQLFDQRRQSIEKEIQTKREDLRYARLMSERTDMENTIACLKEDTSRNYNQLEEQVRSNHKLLAQIDNERLKVAKAEKYIAEIEERIYIVNDINLKYKEQSLRLHEEIKEKYDEVEENFTNQVNDIMNNFKAFKIEMFEKNVKLKSLSSKTEEDIGNLMETVEENYKKDNIIDLPKYMQG